MRSGAALCRAMPCGGEIKKTVEQVNEAWAEREEMVQMALEGLGRIYCWKKRIFYDTDMINEEPGGVGQARWDCPGAHDDLLLAQRGTALRTMPSASPFPGGMLRPGGHVEEYEEHLENWRIGRCRTAGQGPGRGAL